jgi:FMN phosphatase YigB (HAD superfamily)
MLPNAVVFDLGKVLVDFDYSIAADRIAARSRLAPGAVRQFIDHSPVLFSFETGHTTREQFYSTVCAATGYDGSLEEFAAVFGDIFFPIEPMIRLHAAIRRKGFPTYIFSNTNDIAVAHIRRRFPFFSHFDGYILSYEHGAMKPDTKLYELVERQSSRRQQEILYVDDRPENIAAGAARGWQVILQETPEKTFAAVEKLGLLRRVEGDSRICGE